MSTQPTTVGKNADAADEKLKNNSSDISVHDDQDEDIVNPWEVKAGSSTGVDYDKVISELKATYQCLISDFGVKLANGRTEEGILLLCISIHPYQSDSMLV